ncbi:ATP-binding protein [Halopenitus persicus]|uniref:ATP-binding protein n=1 Tax=Halopenitus persicus TaxID=1048396 RepID=UPI000BBB3477|nr:ATP-binding protein [Halopenitus persicus]
MIDRERELEWLRTRLAGDDRELLVVYGRRRVGKTTLVTAALEELEAGTVYFLCDQRGTRANARRFASRCAERFDDVPPDVDGFPDAFRYLRDRIEGAGVVAIDEFSYLVEADETVPSVFQTVVDDVLTGTDVSIVLLGSSISMMEEGVLSYESPLYGRRTGQWRLEPLPIASARQFFPEYGPETMIETYGVVGGIPAYLEQFEADRDLLENVERHVLSKGAFLHEEPEFLLRQELREPATYLAILEAIAGGATRVSEIASVIDRNASDLSRYLKNLAELAILKRETPVTDPDGRGVYRLTDDFLRFWFRYVSPNRATLEQGHTGSVRETIAETMPTHTSVTFEDICQQTALLPAFPVPCSRVGRWWYGEDEIDVVGLDPASETVLLGECKWTRDPVDPSLLSQLETLEPEVRWRGEDRTVRYALFARSGFTEPMREIARDRADVELYTPARLFDLFDR